ncbi:MAG: hypothetical protein KF683_22945 [Rubrivivax sp.]|nr:hypothetical protein [Rubrivivax sp.]
MRRLAAAMGCVATALPVVAQTIYGDDMLLAEGRRAYQRSDCLAASRFLFAYQQRDPALLRQDAGLRTDLSAALRACEEHLAAAARTAGVSGKADDPSAAGAPAPRPLPPARLQAGSGTPPVHGRCDIYASIAVAQQAANLAQSCGLQGPMWNARHAYHYQWCIGAPEADRRAGTRARQDLLDNCRR